MNPVTAREHITAVFEQKRDEVLKQCLVLNRLHEYSLLDALVPTTDLDAGTLIRETFGDLYTFIPTSKSGGDWYFWNGAVHEQDSTGLICDHIAVAFADFVQDIAGHASDGFRRNASTFSKHDQESVRAYVNGFTRYARLIRSTSGLNNLKTRIETEFKKTPDYFDHDQQWAVMADGMVLDLEDIHGGLLPPDPSRPVLRQLGVSLDLNNPPQPSPLWQQSLDQWVPNRQEQEYLQLAAGAAMLGRGDAKNIVALVGVSNTGKSTYLNVMKDVFGTYAGALPATAILQKYGGASNFEQHKARGKRFLHLSEPQNQRTDDSFLKNLAGGGEAIPTAQKGRDAVDWHAQCVLHIGSNHIPRIDTRDNAIVERINIVAFDNVFGSDGAERVDRLDKKLFREEGPQILEWILEGAEKYNELGAIPVPDSIKKRAQSNVVEASVTLRWLLDCVEEGVYEINPAGNGSDMLKPKDGYEAFRQWCFNNGEKTAPNQKTWLKEIEAYTKRPKSKATDWRPGGYARVWAVVPVQSLPRSAQQTCTTQQQQTYRTFNDIVGR